ncbi:hypothetical protein BU16DRAFT_535502 [Lophium mytilinum]|uniref:Uncharacterized protein n=1 Tax=Lophium mytilinum TaxID=390894 RepID=A0A6A6R440_9PEZI|nr:hypothetical protein BU16DRAFT_535502 [Lophium mytilinum]
MELEMCGGVSVAVELKVADSALEGGDSGTVVLLGAGRMPVVEWVGGDRVVEFVRDDFDDAQKFEFTCDPKENRSICVARHISLSQYIITDITPHHYNNAKMTSMHLPPPPDLDPSFPLPCFDLRLFCPPASFRSSNLTASFHILAINPTTMQTSLGGKFRRTLSGCGLLSAGNERFLDKDGPDQFEEMEIRNRNLMESYRDKRLVKKAERAAKRPKILTSAEVNDIKGTLHPKKYGNDDDGSSNHSEIEGIEKDRQYNADRYNTGMPRSPIENLVNYADVDVNFKSEMTSFYCVLRITELIRLNSRNRGFTGRTMKTIENLFGNLKTLVMENFIQVKKEDLELRMRRGAYLLELHQPSELRMQPSREWRDILS